MIYNSSKNAYYRASKRGVSINDAHKPFGWYFNGKFYLYNISVTSYYVCDTRDEIYLILGTHVEDAIMINNRKLILEAL